MVKSYLEQCRQELLELQIDLTNQVQKIDLLMKEKIELIQYIESSEDESYDSFVPQNFRSDMNRQKIKNIRDELKQYEDRVEDLQNRSENVEYKIKEIESVIQVNKENESLDSDMKRKLDDNEFFRLKVLQTQELERQRIARDLHDSVVQNLTSLIHRIELCNRLMDMDKERCKIELQNMSRTLRDTIQQMREDIYDLHPISLDDVGLDITIQKEIERLIKNSNLKFSFKSKGDHYGILPVISLTIFRIIQEACNNTIHHANAKNFWISMEYGDSDISFHIEDDGCGFDLNQDKQDSGVFYSGFGLSAMYERVYLLSGTINIQSEINHGTKIDVVIPKKEVIDDGNQNYDC